MGDTAVRKACAAGGLSWCVLRASAFSPVLANAAPRTMDRLRGMCMHNSGAHMSVAGISYVPGTCVSLTSKFVYISFKYVGGCVMCGRPICFGRQYATFGNKLGAPAVITYRRRSSEGGSTHIFFFLRHKFKTCGG